jgi:hypothetical protein
VQLQFDLPESLLGLHLAYLPLHLNDLQLLLCLNMLASAGRATQQQAGVRAVKQLQQQPLLACCWHCC